MINKIPAPRFIMDGSDIGEFENVTNDALTIVIKSKTENGDNDKKLKRRRKKYFTEMWENEDFMQIKGIQRTQEAVNRSLRHICLEKMRLSRIKRIGEVSDYERRRREAKQQNLAMKNVLQKALINNELLWNELDLNETNNIEADKENVLINNKNALGMRPRETNKQNISVTRSLENKTDILPPLVRTTRRRSFMPMATARNSSMDLSSNMETKSETKVNDNYGGNKKSIVITIPDINTDANLYSQRSEIRLSTSADSSRRSLSAKSEKGTQCSVGREHENNQKDGESRINVGKASPDLPPIKFTLHGTNGPPVSYYIDKDNMVSYRPTFGIPVVRGHTNDDKPHNPSIIVTPPNSSVSIPLVRKEHSLSKENLSIIGKNPQQPPDFPSQEVSPSKPSMRLVSSYDLTSNTSETSSRPGSRTTPRTSMKGHKLLKKKLKEPKPHKELKHKSNTGLSISEFSVHERSHKRPDILIDKTSSVHEFPVHVRERYIKKKLLLSKADKQEQISWKVRQYVTDPGSISSPTPKNSPSLDIESSVKLQGYCEESLQQNKKDISDLLLRMFLKQAPRNKIHRERTVPSDDRMSVNSDQRQFAIKTINQKGNITSNKQ